MTQENFISEFKVPEHAKDPLVNLKRSLSTNVEKTHKHYLSQFLRLASTDNLGDGIHEVGEKHQNGNIKYSTLRLYKSSYLFGIGLLVSLQQAQSLPDFVTENEQQRLFELASKHNPEYLNTCYNVVLNWRTESFLKQKLLDATAEISQRSSAHRAKYLNPKLVNRLQQINRKGLVFANLFLPLNCVLGLRPHEWYSASLVKTNGDVLTDFTKTQKEHLKKLGVTPPNILCLYWLKVQNSKYNPDDDTLIRACGKYRYLGIGHFDKTFIRKCDELIKYIKKKCPTHEHYEKFLKRQNRNLTYALTHDPVCQEIMEQDYQHRLTLLKRILNKRDPDNSDYQRYLNAGKMVFAERPTFYSSRHQAIANAKNSGLDPVTIASLFGHISDLTAQRHYGKKKDGKFGLIPQASSLNLAIVAEHLVNLGQAHIQRQERPREQEQLYETLLEKKKIAEVVVDALPDEFDFSTPKHTLKPQI